eukprot:2803212-Pleurochrysis_carterae.AAC.5
MHVYTRQRLSLKEPLRCVQADAQPRQRRREAKTDERREVCKTGSTRAGTATQTQQRHRDQGAAGACSGGKQRFN